MKLTKKIEDLEKEAADTQRAALLEDADGEDEGGEDELSQIFWDNEYGPDSWVIDDGIRWVYLSDGMYISEFGDMRDL